MSTPTLEQRIYTWMATCPDSTTTGEQLLSQLSSIGREFEGPTRDNLIKLVEETFTRHIQIRQSRDNALAHLETWKRRHLQKIAAQLPGMHWSALTAEGSPKA